MEIVSYGEIHIHTNNKNKPAMGKHSAEMALIKRRIKMRDNNKCQVCGEEDKPLEVHHIFPQSKYPEMMGNTANLITICQSCHRKYHDEFEGSEGAVSFAKYIRDKGEFK